MWGKKLGLALLAGTVIAAWGCGDEQPGRAEAGPFPLTEGWGHRPEFADGKAEVNTYAAVLTREGAPRDTRAYTVFVAEDLDPEILVKADDASRPGLTRVFKYALVTSTQTGMMEYREATNAFIAVDDWRVVKLVHSHQDWCGLTHELLLRHQDETLFRWTGYWEQDGGMGEKKLTLAPDAVPVDALPAWIRGLDLRDGLDVAVELLPSLEGSKVGDPAAVAGRFKVSGPAEVTVRAGTFSCWEVRADFGTKSVRISVERAFPHRVIRWTDERGQTYALVKSQREAYWARHADGEEALLEP